MTPIRERGSVLGSIIPGTRKQPAVRHLPRASTPMYSSAGLFIAGCSLPMSPAQRVIRFGSPQIPPGEAERRCWRDRCGSMVTGLPTRRATVCPFRKGRMTGSGRSISTSISSLDWLGLLRAALSRRFTWRGSRIGRLPIRTIRWKNGGSGRMKNPAAEYV